MTTVHIDDSWDELKDIRRRLSEVMLERDDATNRLSRAHSTIDQLRRELSQLRDVLKTPRGIVANENLRLAKKVGEFANLQW